MGEITLLEVGINGAMVVRHIESQNGRVYGIWAKNIQWKAYEEKEKLVSAKGICIYFNKWNIR